MFRMPSVQLSSVVKKIQSLRSTVSHAQVIRLVITLQFAVVFDDRQLIDCLNEGNQCVTP